MKQVAEKEGIDPEKIRRGIANGRIVITKNINKEIPAVLLVPSENSKTDWLY